MTEIHYQSATELMARLDAREVGARELLEHFLDRVERHNQAINAIIWRDADRARAEADASDRRRAAGEATGPLDGLPVTVKESFDLTGSPTTWGVPEFRDNIAAADSAVVEKYRAAGAVVFGKTNVPLMLSDWQSFNSLHGTCSNPWDLTRTPGGSSGGSAAALAAGLTGLDAGSDIGASIRNPAHYCGVFGHKPTWEIVSGRGQVLPGDHAPTDIAVVGPLARSASDLKLALGLLAGADGPTARGWRLELPEPRRQRLRDYRVGVLLSDSASRGGAVVPGRHRRARPLAGERGRDRRVGCEARLLDRGGDGDLHDAAARRDLQAPERRDDGAVARGLWVVSRRTRSPTAAGCWRPRPCRTGTGSGGTTAATR